jgi:hypothetical protein
MPEISWGVFIWVAGQARAVNLSDVLCQSFWDRVAVRLRDDRGHLRVYAVPPIALCPTCPEGGDNDCFAVIGEDDDLVGQYLRPGAPRHDWNFFVEGILPGDATLEAEGTLDDERTRRVPILLHVVKVDADVDSDNTQTISPYPPDRTVEEDNIEQRIAELKAWATMNPARPYEAGDRRDSICEGGGE